jgi:hypothetical protein
MKSRRAFLVATALLSIAVPSEGAWARQVEDPGLVLESLAGEWSVVAEATLGPGQEPVRTESRVVARRIGAWLVAESTGAAPGGQSVTSIRTLGYDPADERFVGTWISSMQTHLWRYAGALDAAGASITLETEGPIMGEPTTSARYREIIEIQDADHHVIRSLIFGPDGEWFEFARAEHRRVGLP